MEFANSIVKSPYFTIIVVTVVVALIGLSRRRRLPLLDRFGLTKDEQGWLSSYQAKSWVDAVGLLAAILISWFLMIRKAFDSPGVILVIIAPLWIHMRIGRGAVRKILDYINKLEQTK